MLLIVLKLIQSELPTYKGSINLNVGIHLSANEKTVEEIQKKDLDLQ